MSVAKLRRRVNEKRDMPRLGKSPSTVIDVDTGEALCDLADAARDYLRAGPLAEWEDAYERMGAAVARLDGEDPADTRPTVDLDDESGR